MKNQQLTFKINLVTILLSITILSLIYQTGVAQVIFPNVRVNDITTRSQAVKGNKSIAVLDNNVYVVWEDERTPNIEDIYFARSTNGGASFSPNVIIYSSGTADTLHLTPSIVVDNQGIIYIAWSAIKNDLSGGNILFTKSLNGGVSFQPPIRITASGLNYQPSLAVFGNNVYISFMFFSPFPLTNYKFVRSTNGGASFGTPFQINNVNCVASLKDGGGHSLCVDNVGNIYTVWTDGRRANGKGDIYFAKSTDAGTSFGTNIPVNNISSAAADSVQYLPVVTVGATNKVYVAFIDERLGSMRQAYLSISQNGGNSFAPEVLVGGFSGGCNEVDIAALPNDRLSVVMNSHILPSGSAIWLFESTNGGVNFSAPVSLSDTYNVGPGDPSMILTQDGSAYVVFNDERLGNKDVYFSKKIVPSLPQTSHRYHETFSVNNEVGWAFTAHSATINTQNGKLNFSSTNDEIVRIYPPIVAAKDDFSIKVNSTANCEGAFGRLGFRSFIGISIDDSIRVVYSENIQSHNDPNFIQLKSHPMPPNVTSIRLDVTRSGNNLTINAFVNEISFYIGQLTNVSEALFTGQFVAALIKKNTPIINMSIDEVDIHYNPVSTTNNFYDGFDNQHSPWSNFGDWNNIYQSITISNSRLNFNYLGTAGTYLYVIPPVGAVRDFSVEVEGGAGSSHNAPFSISRFFDYLNYTTMWFENDTLYIGYAINSIEPTIINKVRFASSITKLKFSVEGNAPILTLNVWANEVLVLTGTINNATARLGVGHICLGHDRGNVVNAYLNYASINYTRFVTSIDENRVSLVTYYVLYQNYPNPFNPSTKIKFSIPQNVILSETENLVTLKVYDILGSEVTKLINEYKSAGTYEIEFNASHLPSGIYFYKITVDNISQTKAMLLLR